MNRYVYRWLLSLFCAVLFSSCTGPNQFLSVQIEPSFKNHKDEFKKAVAIAPNIIWIEKVKDAEGQLLLKEEREELIHRLLEKNAQRAGIDLSVISPLNLEATQVSYFNELLPLKEQILQSNFLQETSSRAKFNMFIFQPSYYQGTFTTVPILDSEYSWLSEEYETPYFIFQGLIVKKKYRFLKSNWRNLYFAVIVDVEKGEIVYREVRGFKDRPSKTHLNGIFYDSFNIIRRLR